MYIQQIPSQAFTPGRACGPVVKVVLHGMLGTLNELDAKMKQPCDVTGVIPSHHDSFHFGMDNNLVHQYVQTTDTAWSFDNAVTAIGAQNCDTINIVLTYGTPRSGGCPPGTPYQPEDYKTLAKLLCQLGFPTVATQVAIDGTELPGFDLVLLQTELTALGTCPPVPVLPSPCPPGCEGAPGPIGPQGPPGTFTPVPGADPALSTNSFHPDTHFGTNAAYLGDPDAWTTIPWAASPSGFARIPVYFV